MTYQILRGKRFWLLIILPILIGWGSYQLYLNKSVTFSTARITSDFTNNPDWAVEDPEDLTSLKPILHQPFKFLAVGSQSYAFVSADDKYVIKFFIMKHRIPRLSDLWKPEQVEDRKQKLFSIFKAHKLAYTELKQDTGLVYLHLNKTRHLKTPLTVIDRLGRTHQIDLDQTEFVIQEKAELIFTRLKKLIDQGKKQQIQASVSAILALVQRRMDHGICDHDKAVKHNYGFIGDRAVHLDIGRIDKIYKPKEKQRIIQRIDKWLQENDSSI